MFPFHGTRLLMTMSSCLCPGSNLELRWRRSALVFFFFFQDETGSMRCQRYPTASLMHVRKIKEMDAGATSRALPMGNRLPLKAWQGKKKQQK